MKAIGKTTRPFRYDLNQIPYDYTAEVRNRFKGVDLIDRVPEELWTEARDIVEEAVIKTTLKKKKCKEAKQLSEEALQTAVKRREVKGFNTNSPNIYPSFSPVPFTSLLFSAVCKASSDSRFAFCISFSWGWF